MEFIKVPGQLVWHTEDWHYKYTVIEAKDPQTDKAIIRCFDCWKLEEDGYHYRKGAILCFTEDQARLYIFRDTLIDYSRLESVEAANLLDVDSNWYDEYAHPSKVKRGLRALLPLINE